MRKGESERAYIIIRKRAEKEVIYEKRAKARETREACLSYASRIKFLRGEATEEGITFNENSGRDFWKFIGMIPFARRGQLFLMDGGDLRAVWDDDKDNLIGIQFLGNFSARYVIFRRRTENGPVSRVAGSDTLKGINARLKHLNWKLSCAHERQTFLKTIMLSAM